MIKKILVGVIRIYQKTFPFTNYISKNLGLIQTSCKFKPTCSEFMIEAIIKYGALKGLILGARRLLRCNPFAKGGLDRVGP